MSTNQSTQALVDRGESATMELVSSATSNEHIAKAAIAFLNSKGGTIIVGLDEENNSTAKLGQRDLDVLEKYLRKTITPPIIFGVSLDKTDYGNVIVVEVPKGRDRPYVFEGRVLVRRGTRIQPADAATIQKMVKEDTDHPRWERRIAAGLSVEDLDVELVKNTIDLAIKIRGMTFASPST